MHSILKAARALNLESVITDPRAQLDAQYNTLELELRKRLERVFGVTNVRITRYTAPDFNALECGTPIADLEGMRFKLSGANDAGVEYLMPDRGGVLVNSLEDFAAYLPAETPTK